MKGISDRIFKELKKIHWRLDDIDRKLAQQSPRIPTLGSGLLSLPDHLRRSFIVVDNNGECDATAVSLQTGRIRATESDYLNELASMGWLTKKKVSKTTIFSVIPERKKNVFASPNQV